MSVTVYIQGENMSGYMPQSENYVTASAENAVRALGDAIDSWVDSESDKPEDEQDSETSFAYGIAEIYKGGRSPEFFDAVFQLTNHGGVGYLFGDLSFWVTKEIVSDDDAFEMLADD
jgi:hypothetical protein